MFTEINSLGSCFLPYVPFIWKFVTTVICYVPFSFTVLTKTSALEFHRTLAPNKGIDHKSELILTRGNSQIVLYYQRISIGKFTYPDDHHGKILTRDHKVGTDLVPSTRVGVLKNFVYM